MLITPFKIFLCLVTALITSFIFKFLLAQNHSKYFKVKKHTSLITFKGFINQKMAIGIPINKQGYILYTLLLTIIALEIFIIIYLL